MNVQTLLWLCIFGIVVYFSDVIWSCIGLAICRIRLRLMMSRFGFLYWQAKSLARFCRACFRMWLYACYLRIGRIWFSVRYALYQAKIRQGFNAKFPSYRPRSFAEMWKIKDV